MPAAVLAQYKNLWHIEKAFRMSKTDLDTRPIYHRLERRIEAHICLFYTAYAIYKELERVLNKEKSAISFKQASALIHTMYQLSIMLPESKRKQAIKLKMDDQQTQLWNIILKNH